MCNDLSMRMRKSYATGFRQQSGFTLIEVLISALILAVGIIGIAGLQGVSLRSNQSAFMRSQATAFAYDLADRMRSNISSANAGWYDPATAAAIAACNSVAGCTPQNLAQNDLSEWNAAITTYLPMGQGYVCIDSTPYDGTGPADPQCDGAGTQFSIKIWWDDDRDGVISISATNTERLAITFQL